MIQLKKQAQMMANMRAQSQNQPQTPRPEGVQQQQQSGQEGTVEGSREGMQAQNPAEDSAQQALLRNSSGPNGAQASNDPTKANPTVVRPGLECIEEVGQIMKTAFPLLIMSLETIVDQISQRFRSSQDEEIHRLICMLLQDAMSVSQDYRSLAAH